MRLLAVSFVDFIGHVEGRCLVVQNEPVQFVLLLQNTFHFDLELQELALR